MLKSKQNRQRIAQITIALTLIITTAIAYSATRPQPDPFAADAIEDAPFTSLTYSIQTFLWWDDGFTGRQLDWVSFTLNFNHIKQTFPWRELEPERGVWDFSQADRILSETQRRDIRVIARLGQVPAWATDSPELVNFDESHDVLPANEDDWATYCRTVAERYQGRIMAYQIWNEPNLAREWGDNPPDAAEYVRLLGVCSEAIRSVDSEAILISAGLAPTGVHNDTAHRDDIYLDQMYRNNFQQYIDVVGVHATGYNPPSFGPDDAVANGGDRSQSFRRIEDLRKIMIAYDDAARQMAILEFGWTTDPINPEYSWFAVSEEEQAQYTVEAYQYAAENWRPWVGLMSLIYMPYAGWTEQDEEYWWAIVEGQHRLRPVFYALIGMDYYCGDQTLPGWQEGMTEEDYREQRIPCY